MNTLFNAMALGDKFLFEVARKVVLSSMSDLDAILYRQSILKDCLKNSLIVKDMYNIAVESIEIEKKHYLSFFSFKYPSSILHRSIGLLQLFVGILKKLRGIADSHADKFESEGFIRFFAMLQKELTDEYFLHIQEHLKELKFREGVLISGELGKGNKGLHYLLHKVQDKKQSWIERLFNRKTPDYTVYIHERDEAGARALGELKDRGINTVANALAQSADHVLDFFTMLRTELAFYVGCLNLQETLVQKGEPIAFPLPVAANARKSSFKGLYDVCLSLTIEGKVVGNDVNADDKDLVMITGANQGGKSIFLRAIGLSQLMMQCGMFAPAEAFCANVCNGLFTHYKREEDTSMKSGKLDEELRRMSDIIDNISENSMILFNESFAATNEREGSEIARQIIYALLEKHIKVFFVTHLYELAHGLYEQRLESATFLRAERQADGSRTFKLTEGEPLQTSFGKDLYNRIFSNAG
ncbi:MAG TPA: hypothetical protein PKA28_11365 [Methylomusa anaerophila]|uniref:MutS-related protein n=1 Tax=Methylomusa anaerophila TaxID=1930071 RepID=UPI0018D4E0AE|nr:hypothetical protein [Methylomusa anaerophila]HML89032.1 hypothetical protein [Methylomusa anaerophila]